MKGNSPESRKYCDYSHEILMYACVHDYYPDIFPGSHSNQGNLSHRELPLLCSGGILQCVGLYHEPNAKEDHVLSPLAISRHEKKSAHVEHTVILLHM